MRAVLAMVAVAALTAAAACESNADEQVPATAPPSRHGTQPPAIAS